MKLNLHLHTLYSDGCDSMECMAKALREDGHVALVTSDHDYCMTPETYKAQVEEAKALEESMQFPIVCGLECSVNGEEAVLIGQEACLAWTQFRLEHRRKSDKPPFNLESLTDVDYYRFNVTPLEISEVLKPFEYALCLVHPGTMADPDLYKLFHCYEIMNSGKMWPELYIQRLQELAPQAKPVKGIDAHSIRYLKPHYLCNEVDAGIIWNEKEVIKWMKTR